MDETPNLGLPYIMAAQSQKHVTHNEAIRALDAIVQLSVLDRNLSAPPSTPAEGSRYIVGGSPSGAWSGHAGNIAAYQDGAWMFYAPVEGWISWIADEDVAVVWSGSAWIALATGGEGGDDDDGGGGEGDFATLGINAVADTTNRLTVAADATLLNHDGTDHRLKINKAAAGDTASLLYQSAFSGCAELGLAGDDDFHFKVSADGSSWKEAILIDRSSGSVSFPFTSLSGGRDTLTADRTYYVRTNGSDSNDGLANTSGGAFLTLQKAVDTIASLDVGIYDVTVQVAAGTYAGGVFANGPWLGSGAVSFIGDTTTPTNVNIAVTNNYCFRAENNAAFNVAGFKVSCASAGSGLYAQFGGVITIVGTMNYGACAFSHMQSTNFGRIVAFTQNYAISGGAQSHLSCTYLGSLQVSGGTVTISGTPAFSTAFAECVNGSMVANGTTWSGSATGVRCLVSHGGAIQTFGGGASYFPGNSSGSGGTTSGGGFYA